MNENRPPEKDGPLNNQAPQIVPEDVDGEQLELLLPPDDGMSLGEWIEWMPKDTQHRSPRFLSRKAA
jgi:hypothetical protein